jgi:hypothetical protein
MSWSRLVGLGIADARMGRRSTSDLRSIVTEELNYDRGMGGREPELKVTLVRRSLRQLPGSGTGRETANVEQSGGPFGQLCRFV